MHVYREIWIRRLLDREARMVDMQIMRRSERHGLFASTSLLAVGGALALRARPAEALACWAHWPIDLRPSPALWEIKCVGLVLIFVYGSSNLPGPTGCSITSPLLGAMRGAHAILPRRKACHRTTRLFEGRRAHFNRGQRAFFFAPGYLGCSSVRGSCS